ncbi:hypothetical protein [Neisseria bergeri]|uniref:hypothetical protein n=1 Tax=Neisseria bergeri TaxID=1906581 RepID=UPI0001D9DCE2|nr:hypothetical protein [Neisseria bergeri]EFH22834.1 hypothetical protein NEIPOLOT_01320 [Neisseria polysaccharea ATCC 43768]
MPSEASAVRTYRVFCRLRKFEMPPHILFQADCLFGTSNKMPSESPSDGIALFICVNA